MIMVGSNKIRKGLGSNKIRKGFGGEIGKFDMPMRKQVNK